MSAVIERSRRKTAGKRVTELAGEELAHDETFWGHETWLEDDSGNESFHSSDEDSELKQDMFDSDFDDSETDHEEEEAEAGEDAEKQIKRQEREKARALTSGRAYVDSSKAVNVQHPAVNRGRGAKGGTKRLVGEGLNAGIVLNIPIKGSSAVHPGAPPLPTPFSAHPAQAPVPVKKEKKKQEITAASFRPTRHAIRVGRQVKTSLAVQAAAAAVGKESRSANKRKRRRYTQEELLLEAVTTTEPENNRWLLGRKRMQAESEKEKETTNRDTRRGTVVEKFVSRRGYLNTINFPSMDHLPPILSRSNDSKPKASAPIFCAITGKAAKYRDPKTLLGYYDAAAFKEIRRHYDAKQQLIQSTNHLTHKSDTIKVACDPNPVTATVSVAIKQQTPNAMQPTSSTTNGTSMHVQSEIATKIGKRGGRGKASSNAKKKQETDRSEPQLMDPALAASRIPSTEIQANNSIAECTYPLVTQHLSTLNHVTTANNQSTGNVYETMPNLCDTHNEANMYRQTISGTTEQSNRYMVNPNLYNGLPYSVFSNPLQVSHSNGANRNHYNQWSNQQTSVPLDATFYMPGNQCSVQSTTFQSVPSNGIDQRQQTVSVMNRSISAFEYQTQYNPSSLQAIQVPGTREVPIAVANGGMKDTSNEVYSHQNFLTRPKSPSQVKPSFSTSNNGTGNPSVNHPT